MRYIVAFIAGLLALSAGARAQTFPCAATVPFIFSNGQVADANQVNTNFATLLNCANQLGRIPISSNLTMFVSSSGSDVNNTCLSALTPCATIQQAINVLQTSYQFVNSGVGVTISVAPGSYTQSTLISGSIPGQTTIPQLTIQGNAGAPDTVSITGDSSHPYVFSAQLGGAVTLQGFECFGANGDCIRVNTGGTMQGAAIDFNTTVAAHIHVDRGGTAQMASYSISGNATEHVFAEGVGPIRMFANEVLNPCCSIVGITVTINGTPHWSGDFARPVGSGATIDMRSITFVNPGNATGNQCAIADNAVVRTSTSGTLVMPGTPSTCTTSNGGVFD